MDKLKYELELWKQGYKNIAGCDEVGRGSFAGPLVTASVIWAPETYIKIQKNSSFADLFCKINDSKKLSSKTRKLLEVFIKKNCYKYSIYELTSKKIDDIGVGRSNLKALVMSIKKIRSIDAVLSDHFDLTEIRSEGIFTKAIKKGDQKSISIASASILAKEYRDNLMKIKYHKMYPYYGFDTNVGYGTKKHREAIKKYGTTKIHRKSFLKNL